MDIIAILAEKGIQIFISTHSYFVIKKLAIVAQREKINIPVMMADSNEKFFCDDMIYGMPENDIIKDSVELYKEEIDVSFGG